MGRQKFSYAELTPQMQDCVDAVLAALGEHDIVNRKTLAKLADNARTQHGLDPLYLPTLRTGGVQFVELMAVAKVVSRERYRVNVYPHPTMPGYWALGTAMTSLTIVKVFVLGLKAIRTRAVRLRRQADLESELRPNHRGLMRVAMSLDHLEKAITEAMIEVQRAEREARAFEGEAV